MGQLILYKTAKATQLENIIFTTNLLGQVDISLQKESFRYDLEESDFMSGWLETRFGVFGALQDDA